MTFDQLGLSPKVLEAVKTAGFITPTPIQAQAIPAALQRRDVQGLAQTGSGKTAAFALPMLTMMEKGRARARMPRTLVLEPTRELAAQVQDAFETLGQQHKLTIALLIGGVSFEDQDRKIDRGADVVIATPGRLLDHVARGKLLLNAIEILVIDEADRMLDMGFIPDIERICKLLPITRQTLFFSATMPPEIQRITNQFLHNPARIEATPPATTAASIEQHLVRAPSDFKAKRGALRDLLRSQDGVKNAIIFANRKTTVAVIEASLKRHGFNAAALHGDMDQHARLKTLDAFRNGEITYLIASDVAARGLDIPDVSHIFNFDVPVHPEDYVHRIGRTGRAGREGHAIMMVTAHEMKALKAIERLIRREIEWSGAMPAAEAVRTRPIPRRGHVKDKAHQSPRQHRHDSTREDRKPKTPVKSPAKAQAKVHQPVQPHRRPQPKQRREGHGFDNHLPAFLSRPVR
ncbi:MAG TPA: DEAD/DEAH box helicase [Aestuariivirgaceae bacterium]|jgi:superfamily II DNA/RNA helicase